MKEPNRKWGQSQDACFCILGLRWRAYFGPSIFMTSTSSSCISGGRLDIVLFRISDRSCCSVSATTQNPCQCTNTSLPATFSLANSQRWSAPKVVRCCLDVIGAAAGAIRQMNEIFLPSRQSKWRWIQIQAVSVFDTFTKPHHQRHHDADRRIKRGLILILSYYE